MNPNTTSTSRRSRSRGAGTSQQGPNAGTSQQDPRVAGFAQFSSQQPSPYRPQFEDPNSAFAQFSQQQPPPYRPQFEDSNSGFAQFSQQPLFSQQFPLQYPTQFPLQFPPQFPQQYPPQYPQQFLQPGYNSGNTPYPDFSTRQVSSSDSSDEVEECVPETQRSVPTQQSNPVSRQEGKKPRTYDNRCKKQKWTREEEVALVTAWVDTSEDSVIGNARRIDGFWGKILETFFELVGRRGYRTTHQVTTKWNDINRKATKFAGIYNNVYNNRQSGQSDVDIMKTARIRFQAEHGMSFNHEHCWEILRNSEKWAPVAPLSTNSSRSSKRSRTSGESDAHFRPDEGDDEAPEEMPQRKRPVGRNRARNASTSTPGAPSAQMMGELNAYKQTVNEQMDYKLKKLELDQRQLTLQEENAAMEKLRRFDADLEFYITPHDDLQGYELAACLAKKTHIKKLHNFNF